MRAWKGCRGGVSRGSTVGGRIVRAEETLYCTFVWTRCIPGITLTIYVEGNSGSGGRSESHCRIVSLSGDASGL